MKKITMLLLALSLLLCISASAEDLGVQPLGGNSQDAVPIYVEDMQLEKQYNIPGYARVTPLGFQYVDFFGQFERGCAGSLKTTPKNTGLLLRSCSSNGSVGDYYADMKWVQSTKNYEYAWLALDIVNMHHEPHAYMSEIKVVCVYDNEYEFVGWVRQLDYNTSVRIRPYYETGAVIDFIPSYSPVIQPADEFAPGMLTTAHYIIGCTLPNAVVEGEEPLRMEITIGEHFFVYHIRK